MSEEKGCDGASSATRRKRTLVTSGNKEFYDMHIKNPSLRSNAFSALAFKSNRPIRELLKAIFCFAAKTQSKHPASYRLQFFAIQNLSTTICSCLTCRLTPTPSVFPSATFEASPGDRIVHHIAAHLRPCLVFPIFWCRHAMKICRSRAYTMQLLYVEKNHPGNSWDFFTTIGTAYWISLLRH